MTPQWSWTARVSFSKGVPKTPVFPRRLSLAAAFAVVVIGAAGLWAQTGAQGDREADLAAIRAEVAKLEARLGTISANAEDAATQLQRTEAELALQEQRLLEARTARDLASEKVEESERRVGELEAELAHAQADLRKRLRGLYRIGGIGYLRLLLSMDPNADSLEGVRLLRFLARRDADAIDTYRALADDLGKQQEELLAQQQEVAAWAAQEEERQQELANLRRRQARQLARLEEERRTLADETGSLREKERKLAQLLERLAPESGEGLEGAPIQDFKGVLDWPAQGNVTLGFGTVRDPRYRTRLPHNGIDLTLDGEQDIKAVYPGSVLFAGPFDGYGSMVVLLHPGRVFSIYTGLGQVRVAQGDVLSLNEVVGVAGDRLYFEMRVEKRPEDPLEWLR